MIPPPWTPKQLEHTGTISHAIDGVDGCTPDMLRPGLQTWSPPSGVRFVKIYGGELDGCSHPADGWYQPEVRNGQLMWLEWIEADVDLVK